MADADWIVYAVNSSVAFFLVDFACILPNSLSYIFSFLLLVFLDFFGGSLVQFRFCP